MSDEEEESMSEGFSASEDEWKPSKDVRDGESSDDDDSEFEESRLPATASNNSGTASGANRKREPKSKTATKQVAIKKRKPAGQSLRTKLYNKYRPPPKAFPSPSSAGSNSPSASTSRTASKNAKAPNESGEHSNDSSSDSSVEDYLVNPAELDLQSSFFNVGGVKVAEKLPSPAPIFDCNAGIANLSDSGSEDNNESSADERAKADTFDFGNLLENVNSLERAKETIAKRAAVAKTPQHADTTAMDVNSLLALGEKQGHAKADKKKGGKDVERKEPTVLEHADHDLGPQKLSKTKSTRVKRHTKTRPTSTVVAGDTDDSDWEEVSDDTHNNSAHEHSALNASGHNENLEIHVELPSRHRAKEKKQQDMELAFRRKVNRNLKERQLQLHKTSLLCHFGRSYFYNRLLNNTALMQAALKLLPSQNAYPPERGTEIKYYQSLVTWYKTAIKLSSPNLYPDKAVSKQRHIKPALLAQIKRKEACCKQDMVFIFVALLRGMGLQCRLVFNLQPLPLKPQQSDLLKITLKRDGDKKDEVDAKKAKVEGAHATKGEDKSKMLSVKKCGEKKESNKKQLEKKCSKDMEGVTVKEVKEKAVLDAKSQNRTHSLSKKVADKEKNVRKKLDQKESTKDEQVDKKQREASTAKIVTKSKEVLKKVAEKLDVRDVSKSKVKSTGNNNEQHVKYSNEELKENKKAVGNESTVESHKTTEIVPNYSGNKHESKSKELSKTDATHANEERSITKPKSVSAKPALSKLRHKQSSVEHSTATQMAYIEKDAEDDRPSISVGFTPIARRTRQATTNMGPKSASAALSNKPVIQVGSPVIPKVIIHGGKVDSSNTSKVNEIENKPTSQTRITRSRSISPKLQISPSFLQTENYQKKFLSDAPAKPKPKRAASKSPTNKVKICTDFLQHAASKNSELVATRVLRSRQKSNEVAGDAENAGSVIPQLDGADDIVADTKKSKFKRPQLKKLKKSHSRSQEDSDEDFEPSPPKQPKKAPQIPLQKRITDRRVLSTDEEDTSGNSGETSSKRKPTAADIWVEVWSDLEEQWVCIDLFKGKIHSVESIRKSATSNFAYVFAFQNDLSVKDVTARYCPNWTTTVRKCRVEPVWLETAISNYYGHRTSRDIKEDQELRRIHEEKPMPTAISEYKDHPLYALERHLLKFQAIYPPNAPTLGFVRGEPVYSRDCVHTLHSRDIWLKQARTVKLGEQPYKIVKARPKWDRLTQTVIKDQPLEIFGYWQTQDYEPPTAENGIVPRNAYGNVELFKECMLPKKTVHLKLPGLNRICKKLGIDCANAVIGFDFHQGACHPLYDGFVVCEEFADQVTAAWYQDQEEQDRKEQEKYEARVYGNWKKLIKGLLIRERLKKKYNF